MNDQKARDALLTDLRCFGYRSGEVTLASGEISDWYVDASQVLLCGDRFDVYKRAFKVALDEFPGFTAAGGLTMGADPMAFLVADASNTKAFSVRKTAKNHGGESERVVGPLQADDKVLVVDDVTTSGGSLQQTLHALEGYDVVAALCLVDRSNGVTTQLFSDRSIPYYSMFEDKDFV